MSQFDKANFFNQIFWLILLFGSFYFILLRNFLPKLSAVLKARRKKVTLGVQASEKFNEEGLLNTGSYNESILKMSGDVRNSAVLALNTGSDWSNASHKDINVNSLKSSQEAYFKSYKAINLQKQYSL